MKEYCSYTLGRKTDFITCNPCYSYRMFNERDAIASLLLLQSLLGNQVCLKDELLAPCVISGKKFFYTLHICPNY